MVKTSRKNFPVEGYRLIEERFVQEVNAVCYHIEHKGTGAKVLKIAAEDPNKTFGIAFVTLPESDSGTPHILEHSVLNGSRNFPVKSPFDLLLKGSLHTFLNAFTGDEFTIYPVASMNTRDYFNLIHVYLDAVFYPLIYENPRIFRQEGWHYELADKSAPLIYQGVVYNEMKGAFSNPERELWYRIQQHLFPENGYRFSAGGYPEAIPSLTYEDFLSFHQRHYHPSNAFIYLYGDADLSEELTFIHRAYLSAFSKARIPSRPARHAPFPVSREILASYPLVEGSSVAQQTFLSMTWVIGRGYDPLLVMILDILADVLVNQEAAPLRKAMREAGIGKECYAVCQNLFQNMFSIVVRNADASDKEVFVRVIRETLKEVISGKIDSEALEGSQHRLAFRLREGNDAQKGMSFLMRILGSWMFTGDPFPMLSYEQPLARMRLLMDNSFVTDFIRRDVMDNPHALLAVLKPEPGLELEIAERTGRELAAMKHKMTPTELEAVLNCVAELRSFQMQEDTPEAISSIPLLKLSDIRSETHWYQASAHELEGIPLLHHDAYTNHIVYANCWFDLQVLPENQLPYAALLTELLGKLDAGKYRFDQLDKALNLHTGGYACSLSSYLPEYSDGKLVSKFRIQLKTTVEKVPVALELLSAIVVDTRFDNPDRMNELLKRLQSRLESHITQNGFGVAATRLESYFSRRGVLAERTRGLDYYWFIKDLTADFQANPHQVMEQLRRVFDQLLNRHNLLLGLTCREQDLAAFYSSAPGWITRIPAKPVLKNDWELTPVPGNEGIISTSKVQYVLQGFDFRKLDLTWDGKWLVLGQILSTDWLQTRIRVIGGAYGGWASISQKGTIYLASYRDPNLRKTLNNFRDTVGYLKHFNADKTAMTRYIIGTIAGLDLPLTPSERGDLAFRWVLEGTTREVLQEDRHAVLATTSKDIRKMHEMIAGILDQQVICVFGNEAKLLSNKDLFKKLLSVQP
jgi:hypothetical protein